ncbi:MAG TPA: alcohol dehydrogenase catalytic domain-containing protein [Blastocatellia bacterium]|nr:alcohol dehydrogenase catalytic domain-containing protein [Blastocatellia bacterium]
MKVARLYDVDDIRIEEEPIPRPGPGDALVKTVACGICTSDIMPWYVRRKAPVVLGHEPVGIIAEIGAAVRGFRRGDRVFVHHHAPCCECKHCRRGDYSLCETWRRSKIIPGGIAEYFLVPETNLATDTLLLPESVSFEDGVLIEPTACVVKSLRKAGLAPGDDAVPGSPPGARPDVKSLVVIGLGIMGQLHVLLGRTWGAHPIIGVEKIPQRIQIGRELGCDLVLNPLNESVIEGVREITRGELADIVIVGPGSREAVALGLACAGRGSRIILFTPLPPGETVEIEPFHLYMNEISLIPSYSCGPPDTRRALELISAGIITARKLHLQSFPLHRTPEAFRAMAEARIVKAVITF